MIYLTPLLRFNSACFHFKVVVNGVVLDCILFDILLFHASAKTALSSMLSSATLL